MIINEKTKRYTRLGSFSLKALLLRVLMSKLLFSHAHLVAVVKTKQRPRDPKPQTVPTGQSPDKVTCIYMYLYS